MASAIGSECLRVVEYLLGDAVDLEEVFCLEVRLAEVRVERLICIHLSESRGTGLNLVFIYNANLE
jgi:hypothetical protein